MSSERPYILLTGATGYVGRHLLWRLLQAGYRVGVMARAGEQGIERRIADALAPFGEADPDNIEPLAADLLAPQCGLQDDVLARLQKQDIAAVVHCAGLTRFDAHLREELFSTNLQGTQRVFALVRALGVPAFHHVSTAFVAGDSARPFGQSVLDVGQGFRNPYEASKFEAERFLHEQSAQTACPAIRIYRPSIVVGGYPLGEHNHVSTVYTFIKALRFLRECCQRDMRRGHGRFARQGVRQDGERLCVPMRVALDPQAHINLVPIERVVDDIVEGLADAEGGITTRSQLGPDFRLGDIKETLAQVVGISGIRLVDQDDFVQRPRTAIENLFHRSTREYQPYLEAETNFIHAEKRPGDDVDIEMIAREFCALLDSGAGDEPATAGRSTLSNLALNTLQVRTPQDYFARLTNGSLGQSLQKRINYVDASIRFVIHGARPFERVVRFAQGTVSFCDADPDFGYELSDRLFMDIVRGNADLRRAFFAGKVRIEGNKEAALKFGFLLGEYLRLADEHIVDEAVGL